MTKILSGSAAATKRARKHRPHPMTHAEHVALARRVHSVDQSIWATARVLQGLLGPSHPAAKIAIRLHIHNKSFESVRCELDSEQQAACTNAEHDADPFPYYRPDAGTEIPAITPNADQVPPEFSRRRQKLSPEQHRAMAEWLGRMRAETWDIFGLVLSRFGASHRASRALERIARSGGSLDRLALALERECYERLPEGREVWGMYTQARTAIAAEARHAN